MALSDQDILKKMEEMMAKMTAPFIERGFIILKVLKERRRR